MKIEHLVESVMNEVSSPSIMNMISQISQFHRIQGSKGYLEAAKFVRSVLEENGLESTLYEFPANGKWEHWGWKAPISWDIKSAECWLIKPIKKRLCRYDDVPMSVITHSYACDFEATLVDIGKGDKAENYERAKGKVALITGSPRRIFHLAAQHDVKGLIIHPNPERTANLGANTVQYDGFWPNADNLSQVTSGFSISHSQALELQKYLESNNEVRVHFKIDAEFSQEGKLHVLESEIKGSTYPNEEVIIIAHLCHPASSANDNASGSATLAEIAINLNRLIYQGIFPRPERTIRFLWVPEFSGTIHWLKKYDDQLKSKQIISVFNLDMVGESPKIIGAPLTINCPSCATPSYLKALLNIAAKYVSEHKPIYDEKGRIYQLNYRLKPFAGGSDHLIFNDKYFSIPSVMFGHEDPFHHSSADSIDKVDPFECKSVATIAGSVAFSLASCNNQFLEELLYFVFLEGVGDMLKHELSVNQDNCLVFQKKRKLELLEKLILQRMESILELKPGNNFQEKLVYFSQAIKAHFSQIQIKTESKETKEDIAKIKIKRNYLGPISYKKLDKADRSTKDKKIFQTLAKEYWGGIPLELLNLADGVLTIEEIFLILNLHYPNVELDSLISLIKLFQKEAILVEVLD
ncbi:MAG: DUF4910 domain-containing protein [Candidatus Heimdallarchaeota archaeon]|nr:MAG: DUF4910 domain-containing protein [Candidatus Heimdallarchaeota archaeon]